MSSQYTSRGRPQPHLPPSPRPSTHYPRSSQSHSSSTSSTDRRAFPPKDPPYPSNRLHTHARPQSPSNTPSAPTSNSSRQHKKRHHRKEHSARYDKRQRLEPVGGTSQLRQSDGALAERSTNRDNAAGALAVRSANRSESSRAYGQENHRVGKPDSEKSLETEGIVEDGKKTKRRERKTRRGTRAGKWEQAKKAMGIRKAVERRKGA